MTTPPSFIFNFYVKCGVVVVFNSRKSKYGKTQIFLQTYIYIFLIFFWLCEDKDLVFYKAAFHSYCVNRVFEFKTIIVGFEKHFWVKKCSRNTTLMTWLMDLTTDSQSLQNILEESLILTLGHTKIIPFANLKYLKSFFFCSNL